MRARQPGGLLLHPAVLGALFLLVANDHYLKWEYPGPVTGILSDVAGLAFFPILLLSIVEIVTRRNAGLGGYLSVSLVVALTFAIVELTAGGDSAYESGLGLLQAPLREVGLVAGAGHGPVVAVSDARDLFALPAVLLGPLLVIHPRVEPSFPAPI